MEVDYKKFLKWAESNNIELMEYQKNLASFILKGGSIIMPRQHGRQYIDGILTRFYQEGLKQNKS